MSGNDKTNTEQWEYCEVMIDYHTLIEELNKLGKQGWSAFYLSVAIPEETVESFNVENCFSGKKLFENIFSNASEHIQKIKSAKTYYHVVLKRKMKSDS